jgi:hypothetical protein
MHSTVAGLRAKNQQPVYLGFWRPVALKPAPLLGVGRKCALELSNSGLGKLGVPVEAELATGLALPLVVGAVWFAVRRAQRALHRGHPPEDPAPAPGVSSS